METFDGMLYVHVYLSLWVLGQALNLSPTSFESRSQLTLKMQDTVKSHEINILSRQGETFYTYNHYIAPECAIWKKQKSAERKISWQIVMYELVFNSIAFIGIGTGTNCGRLHYFVLTEVKASSARATLAGARATLTFLEGTMDLSLTIRSMQFHFKLLLLDC